MAIIAGQPEVIPAKTYNTIWVPEIHIYRRDISDPGSLRYETRLATASLEVKHDAQGYREFNLADLRTQYPSVEAAYNALLVALTEVETAEQNKV